MDRARPGGAAGPQESIRVLSLRVPPTFQASSPVSRELFTAPGVAGMPGGASALNAMIRQLMTAFRPPQPGMPSQPGWPTMPARDARQRSGPMAPFTTPNMPPPIPSPGFGLASVADEALSPERMAPTGSAWTQHQNIPRPSITFTGRDPFEGLL